MSSSLSERRVLQRRRQPMSAQPMYIYEEYNNLYTGRGGVVYSYAARLSHLTTRPLRDEEGGVVWRHGRFPGTILGIFTCGAYQVRYTNH